MRKICITGPEATGKSTLARTLAERWKSPWVPEYAREYLGAMKHPYSKDDLDAIVLGQCRSEEVRQLRSPGAPYLFCDTGPEVLWVWSAYKYGSVSPVIEDLARSTHYDLTLLLDVDLPWEEDPLRETPAIEQRRELLQMYQDLLKKLNRPYHLVCGSGHERFSQASRSLP